MTDHLPQVGDPILYIPRPGQVRSGHGTIAALVTAVTAEGRVSLIAFPPNSEFNEHDKLPEESETITGHCWRRRPDAVAELRAEVADLRQMIDDLTAPQATLQARQQAVQDASNAATQAKAPA